MDSFLTNLISVVVVRKLSDKFPAFSGGMEVAVEEGYYLIERNFSRQEKKTVVREPH